MVLIISKKVCSRICVVGIYY